MLSERMSRRELLFRAGAGLCGIGLASGLSGRNGAVASSAVSYGGAVKGLVKPAPAGWFTQLGDGKIRCDLCPWRCILSEGERARCRVRENRGGKGYTLAFGNPSLIQEDPIERKPFFHVLPGSRALSVSTAGCNLECKFCEVWDMALVNPEKLYSYDMPPGAVVDLATSGDVRSISYAFGEPVVFYEYMMETAGLAKEKGLLNLLHTAGYIRPKPLRELCGMIDAANVDLKSFDPSFYRNVAGGDLEPVLEALKTIKSAGVHLEITNILIPTLNDDMAMIERMCRWIVRELGPGVPLHFARFYPLYKLSTLPRTPVAELSRARDTALKAGLEFVYVARTTGHEGENTFCPDCGNKIIARLGFVVDEIRMKDGACSHCGRAIPGRWME